MEILEFIKEYWHVLIGLTALVVMFVKAEMVNKDHERRLAFLEKEMHQLNPIFLDIKERLISIETTLKLHIRHDSNNTKQ
jgi:hypothetical protein